MFLTLQHSARMTLVMVTVSTLLIETWTTVYAIMVIQGKIVPFYRILACITYAMMDPLVYQKEVVTVVFVLRKIPAHTVNMK